MELRRRGLEEERAGWVAESAGARFAVERRLLQQEADAKAEWRETARAGQLALAGAVCVREGRLAVAAVQAGLQQAYGP